MLKIKRKALGRCAVLAMALPACASLKTNEEIMLTSTATAPPEKVAFETSNGRTDYDYEGSSYKAQWISCRRSEPLGTLLVMHGDKAGYDKERFCQGWIAQSFLAVGFDVLTINRPGFVSSTGKADLAGSQSTTAMTAASQDAVKKAGHPHPVTGIWGYSTGATAAAFLAKNLKDTKFLILGGGVYDLEETLQTTQNHHLSKVLATLKKTGGDDAMADRSLAYDISGLPKFVYIYHGDLDQAVPKSQAEALRDSLAAGEHKVNFQLLKNVAHDIPWMHHSKVLRVLGGAARKDTVAPQKQNTPSHG